MSNPEKPQRPNHQQNTPPYRESPLESAASTCSVVAVLLFVLTFVFQNFFIPSASMASTLLVGDHVVVDRETLAPGASWDPLVHHRDVRRGDIVVFYKPVEENGGHMILVKRVIGIPGDRIHLRHGVVYLNGVAQNQPYAAKPSAFAYDPYMSDFPSVPPAGEPGVTAEWAASLPNHIEHGDLVVPPGHYFVMGDNRPNSLDSRFWGFVPRANILGSPLLVYWSIDVPEQDEITVPITQQATSTIDELMHFFDHTRWRRTFHRVH